MQSRSGPAWEAALAGVPQQRNGEEAVDEAIGGPDDDPMPEADLAPLPPTPPQSIEEMKAAGYSATELRAAMYRAHELKCAGFTLPQLRQARFRAAELRETNYPAMDLIAVGYTFQELKDGGFPTVELLRAAGHSATELISLRYSLAELREGGFTFTELRALNQFSDGELLDAGFKPSWDDILGDSKQPGQSSLLLMAKAGMLPEVKVELSAVVSGGGLFSMFGGGVEKSVNLELRVRHPDSSASAELYVA